MKNILITGTNGFIASNLVKSLNKKYKIIKWEKDEYENGKKWETKLFNIFDQQEVSCVFHLGAQSSTTASNINETFFLNYHTSKFLSNLCSYKNVPLVYASSAACYGIDGKPNSLYSWTKGAAEDIILKNKQIPLRFFNVIGEINDNKGKMSSVGWQAVKKCRAGEKVELYKGKPTRDFVYWRDVISALIFAATNYEELEKKAYDVGTGVSRPFEDMLKLFGIKWEYTDNSHSHYQDYTCADSNKFMPKWKPKFSLEEAVVDWKRELKL